MPTSSWIRFAEIAFVAFLATILFVSWREDRRDRAQLATELAAAHQALAAADARQHDRDAQLQQSLATIASEKHSVQTPAQIFADLPHELPLPVPLVVESRELPDTPQPNAPSPRNSAVPTAAPRGANGQSPSGTGILVYPEERRACAAPGPHPPKDCSAQQSQVVIPPEDLKPLYDFTLDCKACQAKLTAAQGDLADERTKTATLAHERDAALQATRGGSLWRRVTRAAKWFAIGAAAGAIAAKTTHR